MVIHTKKPKSVCVRGGGGTSGNIRNAERRNASSAKKENMTRGESEKVNFKKAREGLHSCVFAPTRG